FLKNRIQTENDMKKLIMLLLAALPLVAVAQTELTPEQELEKAQKELEAAQRKLAEARKRAQKAQQNSVEVPSERGEYGLDGATDADVCGQEAGFSGEAQGGQTVEDGRLGTLSGSRRRTRGGWQGGMDLCGFCAWGERGSAL
ncbi:secreted protein, partial [gut metagenome]